ncbi:MAG: cyanophycin synthetase, partial [Pseudomonadota bacterium]
PLLGKQNVANALAAATCALSAGASLQNIRVGLSHVKPVAGRMKPYRVGQQLLVLDDSYNANPASVAAAAKALVDFQQLGKQVTLVLGALAELGADAATALSELGVALQQTGLARLITVGDAEPVADSFRQHLADGQQVLTFGDKQQVNEFLAGQVWSDSVVLVKGSRSSRMEEVVKKLTTHLTTDRGEQ